MTDRALGTDPTGVAARVIQLALANKPGGTFSCDCKCMTNGDVGTEESELPGYCIFYSTTGTNSTASWTETGSHHGNFNGFNLRKSHRFAQTTHCGSDNSLLTSFV